jgi:hypothetical protein
MSMASTLADLYSSAHAIALDAAKLEQRDDVESYRQALILYKQIIMLLEDNRVLESQGQGIINDTSEGQLSLTYIEALQSIEA